MKSTIIAILLCLIGSISHAASHPAEQTLQQFYSWVIAHPSVALPPSKELAKLDKILSPALVKLIADANTAEKLCISNTPAGDKPNLIEGDIFAGIYEGASEVAYKKIKTDGPQTIADVELIYIDPRFPKAHPHRTVVSRAQLVLHEEKIIWMIRDILFTEPDRSLSGFLKEYISICSTRKTEDNSGK